MQSGSTHDCHSDGAPGTENRDTCQYWHCLGCPAIKMLTSPVPQHQGQPRARTHMHINTHMYTCACTHVYTKYILSTSKFILH